MHFPKTDIKHGLMCLILCVFVAQACAEVTSVITISSSPEGAEVKQLQGSRKITIGKTPIEHKASFHSEKSLLRFEVSKQGFEPQVIKIKADETKHYVELEILTEVARSKDIKDATAKALQQKSEKTIRAVLSDYRSKPGSPALTFYEKIRFIKQSNDYLLMVPIDLGDVTITDPLAIKTWQSLYAPFIYPLSKALNNQLGSTKVRISATSSKDDINFAPKTREIQTVSMECQGGMTFRTSYRTDGSSYSTRVWDPCAYRLPVTFTHEVVDVDTVVNENNGMIEYDLNTKDVLEINDSEKLYQLIKPKVVHN